MDIHRYSGATRAATNDIKRIAIKISDKGIYLYSLKDAGTMIFEFWTCNRFVLVLSGI